MPYISTSQRVAVALAILLLASQANGQSRSSRVQLSNGHAPDGVLEPWKTSDVASVEAGLLEKIQIKLGDHVKVGEPLVEIDSSGLQVQLMIAEAQAAATGREASARAEVQLNERRVEAIRSAHENRFSSQSELDRAVADLRISEGRLKWEVEELAVQRLQIVRLKHQINQRTIVAPINGIVVKLHKEVGEFISPTSPEVLRIIDVSRLRASFFLQVHEVKQLHINEAVKVQLNEGQVAEAVVEHVSPVADGESGLIEVSVLIENPELKILGSRCWLLLDDKVDSAGEQPGSA